jgi:hypothetical protein
VSTGQLETTVVAEAHECAHSLLYTAPTDLGRARRAVTRYREVLSSRCASEVPS